MMRRRMQSSCHSSDLSSSQRITAFECFDALFRLFALSLLEFGCWFWVLVGSVGEAVSFAGTGGSEW
jgi:hypothetical protein